MSIATSTLLWQLFNFGLLGLVIFLIVRFVRKKKRAQR
jgi:large-conductance mechanosensitive channel